MQLEFPEVCRDKFDVAVILDKVAFAARACARESPLTEADRDAASRIDASLRVAIDVVLAKRGTLRSDRRRQLQVLRSLVTELEPLRAGRCSRR